MIRSLVDRTAAINGNETSFPVRKTPLIALAMAAAESAIAGPGGFIAKTMFETLWGKIALAAQVREHEGSSLVVSITANMQDYLRSARRR